MERESHWASRRAVDNLLDIAAILGRGDMRSDMLKEVERQVSIFERFQSSPGVDEKRINGILKNLRGLHKGLISIGPQYLNPVRESEFLNSIKHRSAIPGGTFEFDLPAFSHWLRQPYDRRKADMHNWISNILPLCDSVSELLWLFRNTGEPKEQVAVNGVFHYVIDRRIMAGFLRIRLPADTDCFPEISGGRHRFSIRFKNWPDASDLSRQMTEDVKFDLTIC